MRIKINKKKRKFEVGINKKIIISDLAKIYLKPNEQVTFLSDNFSRHDVVRKDWGYYATPSINDRLKRFDFRTFLIKNSLNKNYIFLVHKNKMKNFKEYCKNDNQMILAEFTNGIKKIISKS